MGQGAVLPGIGDNAVRHREGIAVQREGGEPVGLVHPESAAGAVGHLDHALVDIRGHLRRRGGSLGGLRFAGALGAAGREPRQQRGDDKHYRHSRFHNGPTISHSPGHCNPAFGQNRAGTAPRQAPGVYIILFSLPPGDTGIRGRARGGACGYHAPQRASPGTPRPAGRQSGACKGAPGPLWRGLC